MARSTQVKRRKRRHKDKPKMLTGLDQKGTWSSGAAPNSAPADVVPPASRRDLNHRCVSPAERGKPVALPCTPWEGEPQGDLTGQRGEEEGGSEGRPVRGRLGVGTSPRPQGSRRPSGVGVREPSANRRRKQGSSVGATATVVAGAASATVGNSVAGSAAVTLRLTPRPMGQPRAVTGALSQA